MNTFLEQKELMHKIERHISKAKRNTNSTDAKTATHSVIADTKIPQGSPPPLMWTCGSESPAHNVTRTMAKLHTASTQSTGAGMNLPYDNEVLGVCQLNCELCKSVCAVKQNWKL